MIDASRVAAVVLAAGASSRFGSPKLLATLDGRPILQRVLDVVATLPLAEVLVVLGHGSDHIAAHLEWRDERVARNPNPDAGLSSSLQIGLAALGPAADAALILLGDQPLVRRDVLEGLLAASRADGPPVVVPRYADGGGQNPVLIRRAAWSLAAEAHGDRGLGPVLATHAGQVLEVAFEGSNPDIDTRADLEALETSASTAAS